MPISIDELQIEVNTKAQSANKSIDALVSRLDVLSKSLGRLNSASGNLVGVANGVDRLGKAMQVMNTVKTADFTRLATNLTKLGNINVSALNSTASSLSHLTRAFNSLGTVSPNALAIGDLVKNISKLGNKSVQNAITNIPQLAVALNNLMKTLSKAPTVSKNIIQMTNALANLASQGSRVGTASRSLQTNMNRLSSSFERTAKSSKGLVSSIGMFYARFFLIIRVIKGLWRSIESTADYIEAFNYFNVALGKIGSDWSHQYEQYGYASAEAYADSFATRLQEKLGGLSGLEINIDADGMGLITDTGLKNLGLNIQQITQYASQLASVTNSVGQAGEVSLATASAFTKLGADLSSLFNLDYSSVMGNLQGGILGQSRALYKYGIDITNARLETLAYELGLEKAVSEMTQMEKMQLRLIAILDQSRVSWGDLANTINSPSNMIRQFTNNLKETGIVLGQLFIPLLQKVMPVINGITIAIKRLLTSIASLLGIKLDLSSFGQGYTETEEGFDGLSDSLDGVAESAKKAKAGLRAFDELKVINMPDASGAGAGAGVGNIDLTQEILDATSKYEKAWQEAFAKMENAAQKWADRISLALKPITDPLTRMFQHLKMGGWSQAGSYFSEFVVSLYQGLIDAIGSVDWDEVGNAVGLFLKNVDWIEIIKKGIELRVSIAEAIAEVWFGSFEEAPIETALLTAFGLMKFTKVGKLISDKIALSLTTALTSVGGFGGLLTMDMGTILGAGTATEIGLMIGTAIIGGITAAFAGYNLGKTIGKWIFPDEKELYDNFKLTELPGYLAQDWKTSFDGLIEMASDFENHPVMASLTNILTGPLVMFMSTLKNAKEDWANFSDVFKERAEKIKTDWLWLAEQIKKSFDNIQNFWKLTFITLGTGAVNILNKAIQGIEDFVNGAIDAFSHFINLINPVLDKISGGSISISVSHIDIPKIALPTYQTGGFPEDGLFMANHSELVGKFSNGKTAVANNEQIIGGIKQGVKEAVAEILAPYLADIAQNTRETADKNFGITRDEVGRAAQSWARDYNRRTGGYAYM